MLDEARLARLLAYCRIDCSDPEDVETVRGLYAAAVAYLEGAGVAEPPEGDPRRPLYDLAVDFMVLRDYDIRDATLPASSAADNPAFRRMIVQLKLSEPDVSDSDTEGG